MVQMHMMIVNYGCGTCRSKPCANSFAPMFFFSVFFLGGASFSLELVVDSISAALRLPLFCILSFCPFVATATSLLEIVFEAFEGSGKIVMVWAVSRITLSAFLLKDGSSFEPRALSLTKMVESNSSWKSVALRCGSCSEKSDKPFTTFDFTVFGSLPTCLSNGDLPSFFLLTSNEYKISDNPDLSLLKMNCLFARNLSFFVLISLSIFPFPDVLVPGILHAVFLTGYKTERTPRLQILYPDPFFFFVVPRTVQSTVLKILTYFLLSSGVKISPLSKQNNGYEN